jgi:tetratricopeptide (TPR) repeat protein
MSRMRLVLTLLLLAVCMPPRAATQTSPRKTPAKRPAPSWPNVSKQNQQRALKLLQDAEAGAASLDAESRVVAYTDLARSYEKRDRAKSIELLDTAFSSAQQLEQKRSDRGLAMNMLGNVLREFATIAPERLDVRIFDMSRDAREMAADLLVPYYVDHKQLDRAYDVIMRVGQEAYMPFGPAMKLMEHLGDRPEQLRSLFVTSLASYENDPMNQGVGFNDFAAMIVEFHDRIPPEVVVRAVDAVLAQAKEFDKTTGRMDVSIASSKAAVHLGSAYEYRLFQLLPVLQQIDPSRAEGLLKDNRDVAGQLDKYPTGTQAFNSDDKDSPGTSMTMSVAAPSMQDDTPSAFERHRFAAIVADAGKHPQDAIASAALLSPDMALDVYMAVARKNVTSDTSSARQGLAKALEVVDKQPLERQVVYVQRIAALYQQLGETDSAKKSLEKAMGMASQIYKGETTGDHPNRAPVALWLSTNAWRFILATALKVDPVWAQSLLKDIVDDRIVVFNEISMADAMLGIQVDGVVATIDPNDGMTDMHPFAIVGEN